MKSNEDDWLTEDALDTLMQEEWLEAMGALKREYQNIPVPTQAQTAVQKGIQRAKDETACRIAQPTKATHSRRFWGSIAALATAAAAVLLFVTLNANPQLAAAIADVPALKPAVELITGQEYHKDVYLDIKVAHLAGQEGTAMQDNMPLPLSDLFQEGAEYIAVISDAVKQQLQQSEQDTGIAAVFAEITPEQNYYFNAEGNLVIVLDQYEAAPEFIIDIETLKSILK